MIRTTTLAALLGAVAFAAPAVAQDTTAAQPPAAQPYVGISAGYHDIFDNPFGDDGGLIGGVVAGVDVPAGEKIVLGVEGNFHVGTGVVDTEYGVAGRIGYRFPSGGLVYARAGYQWINIDIGNLINAEGIDDIDDFNDDVESDYLVGVGGEFPIGGSRTKLRVGVDTVSFDTWRPNVGVTFGF